MAHLRYAAVALALLGIAACLWILVTAGQEAHRTLGPTKAFAAADGSLHVVSHGMIHVFSPDGARRSATGLDALGASLTPSDFAVHADGRWVIVDPDQAVLLRCAAQAPPCQRLDLGLAPATIDVLLPSNAAKVHINDGAKRYYVSDNAGHRVVIADFEGRVLARSSPPVVRYPNQLALAAPGALAVVDTNHRRLAVFDVRNDRIGPVISQIRADAPGVTRGGRRWPFDAVRLPGGETWMLIAREGMKDADLVAFDASGRPIRRIDLGEDSDPFDIERWGERVIVADGTNYRLQSIGLEPGARPTAFGDAAFRAELEAAREKADGWRARQRSAQVGLVAIPLFAIFVLWRLGSPLTRGVPGPAVAPGPAAAEAGTQSVDVDPAFLRKLESRMRVLTALMLASAVLMAAGILALWALRSAQLPWALFLPFAILVPGMGAVPFLLRRQMRRMYARARLVASAGGLTFVPAARREAEEVTVPWSDVFYDGQRILGGKWLVSTRTPRREAIYPPEALAAVLARVGRDHRVSSAALAMRALRRGNPELVASAILIVLALAALALLGTR